MLYRILGGKVSEFLGNDFESRRSKVAQNVIATRVKENWKVDGVHPMTPITLEGYLDTVSFTPKEIRYIYNRLRQIERLILEGNVRKAQKLGNFLIGSRLLTKAATHNVLRDRTSPGYGRDLYRKPWFLNIDLIRKLDRVVIPRMRVWLPKPDGSLRPLAIPTLDDRIRERAMVTVLELLAARRQSSNSIGFRYNQDRHRGLEELLSKAIRKYGEMGFNIVDTDFRKYYDSIPHSGLRTIMRRVGLSGRAWRYFVSTLTAPVRSSATMVAKATGKITGPMAGERYIPEKGTPQGGVLSPLLANLYGGKLDKGLESQGLIHCRYADNVLVAYPASMVKEEIIQILNSVKPHGIELHPNKTQYLVGEGVLVTLGCVVIRKDGRVQLKVSEGYLKTPVRAKERLIRGPFGGIPYFGNVLDFLRNLSLHSIHQRSTDRRGWSRRVGNVRSYFSLDNPLGFQGGVWREIRVKATSKGVGTLNRPPWHEVKSWCRTGVIYADLLKEVMKHRSRVLALKEKNRAVLSCKLACLSGLKVLQEGFTFQDGYLYYSNLDKIRAKYHVKSNRYAYELAGKDILSNRKGEILSPREMGILSKGLSKGTLFLGKRKALPRQIIN